MPKTATRPVEPKPAPGEPGSGHRIVAQFSGDHHRASCICGWPETPGEWRLDYEDARVDWKQHAAEVGTES